MPETHRVNRLIAPSRDTHNNWNDKDPVILEGVLGFTKNRIFDGSLEYFVGDGVHRYSELPKYGGVPASTLNEANTLVLRDADGLMDAASIPDATDTTKGGVKASTTTKPDNVVKADNNGSLSGWKESIINAIIAADGSGGLAKDSNGNMVVDFDQMPTDKFEALLKSLKMQIPLEANLDVYVDKNHNNADDTIIDGRGTQNKPFKTIQAAVDFVTQNYALGTHFVFIRVADATYNENLRLPTFTRTSGYIIIRAADYANPPKIVNTSPAGTCVTALGGTWYLRRLKIYGEFTDPNNGVNNFPGCIFANNSDTSVYVEGCEISASYAGSTPSTYLQIRMLSALNGAQIALSVLSNYHNTFSCTIGNANNATVLCAERSGMISIPSSNVEDTNVEYTIPCSGTISTFATAIDNARIYIVGGGQRYQQFSGSMTGNAYNVSNGSSIYAPSNGFPVTGTGTVDATTYSWYKA